MNNRELSASEAAFEKKTKFKLGKRIYVGDGAVYKLKGQPDKLVKIVDSFRENASNRVKILKYLKNSNNPAVVKIHKYGHFDISDDKYYYYIMDKLFHLRSSNRDLVAIRIRNVLLHGSSKSELLEKEKRFVKNAFKLKYRYTDIHEFNIMKNKRGSLKFIDLESFR